MLSAKIHPALVKTLQTSNIKQEALEQRLRLSISPYIIIA